VAALAVGGEGGYLPAQAAATAEAVRAWLGWAEAAFHGDWQAVLGRERYWLVADGLPRILG
jgi:hypothetical protein